MERVFVGRVTEAGIGVSEKLRTQAEIIESAHENYTNYLRLMGEGKPEEAGKALKALGDDLRDLLNKTQGVCAPSLCVDLLKHLLDD